MAKEAFSTAFQNVIVKGGSHAETAAADGAIDTTTIEGSKNRSMQHPSSSGEEEEEAQIIARNNALK